MQADFAAVKASAKAKQCYAANSAARPLHLGFDCHSTFASSSCCVQIASHLLGPANPSGS